MPRRPSTEEWIALLAEYEQSGLQQKEFCAKHDLSLSAFQYWMYRWPVTSQGSRQRWTADRHVAIERPQLHCGRRRPRPDARGHPCRELERPNECLRRPSSPGLLASS